MDPKGRSGMKLRVTVDGGHWARSLPRKKPVRSPATTFKTSTLLRGTADRSDEHIRQLWREAEVAGR